MAISFSYFFFSLAAFVHRVAYLWLVLQTTVHPIFAISPVDKPGCLLLTSGQCVEPKTVKAVGGLLGALASFFFLVTAGRDVIFHLPVRASVATLCQIFELSLVLCRHGRPSLPTFLGDSEKLMEEPGCVSLCSSQQVHMRKAPGHLALWSVGVSFTCGNRQCNLVVGFLRIPRVRPRGFLAGLRRELVYRWGKFFDLKPLERSFMRGFINIR